jgi:integrase
MSSRPGADDRANTHDIGPRFCPALPATVTLLQLEISLHVLPHTHGSALAMEGVAMGVIAEQLGHADARMTEKDYAHLTPA